MIKGNIEHKLDTIQHQNNTNNLYKRTLIPKERSQDRSEIKEFRKRS